MSLISKFTKYIKAAGIYFVASLIPMILNVAINPLIAMNMSPEDYAIVGYYTSFNTLISPLIVFYMFHYYSKMYFELDFNRRTELRSVIFKSLIFFSLFVSIVCLLGIVIYTKFFNLSSNIPLMPYVLLSVLAIPLTGIFTLMQTDYKMERNSVSFFYLTIMNGLLLVLMTFLMVILLKWGAFGKLLSVLLVNLIFFVICCWKCRYLFKYKFDWFLFGRMIHFCFPLALSAMLGFFSNGYDRVYLERVGNNVELGFYVVGIQIGSYLSVFASAIFSTFQPDIFESVVTNNRRLFLKTASLIILSVALISFIFIGLAPFIIDVLTAGRYVDSSIYAQIYSLSIIFSAIYYVVNDYTIAKGYPQIYLVTTIFSSLSVVFLLPILIGKWEYNGAVMMISVSYIISVFVNVLLLVLMRKRKNESSLDNQYNASAHL